jgi:hypothetical protein
MSKTDLTAGEVFDSLTGFDEMAISQHFGHNVTDLAENSTMWARALVFVLLRRDEQINDDDARDKALKMSLKDVTTYFAEESAESGKGVTVPEVSPTASLISVS